RAPALSYTTRCRSVRCMVAGQARCVERERICPTRRPSDLESQRRTRRHYCSADCDRQPDCAPASVTRDPRSRSTERNLVVDRSPDRKSTRLNSSHVSSSYAVFCLKKESKIVRGHV